MTTKHVWDAQGFCIYCHNVHRTDDNARSTCSDGFSCARPKEVPLLVNHSWVQIATYGDYMLWCRVCDMKTIYRAEKHGITPGDDEFGGYYDVFTALKQKGIK